MLLYRSVMENAGLLARICAIKLLGTGDKRLMSLLEKAVLLQLQERHTWSGEGGREHSPS